MHFEKLVEEPTSLPNQIDSSLLKEASAPYHHEHAKSSVVDLEGQVRERKYSALELASDEMKSVPLIDKKDDPEDIPQTIESPGAQKKQQDEPPKNCIRKCKAWAKYLKRSIGIIMIALKNPELPCLVKCIAWFTVIYALSPIDLIPDCIPILGYLDDLIIVPIGIWMTIKLIPQEIWDAAEEEYNRTEHTKPKKDWRGAVIVVGIWIAFGVWIGKLIWAKWFAH